MLRFGSISLLPVPPVLHSLTMTIIHHLQERLFWPRRKSAATLIAILLHLQSICINRNLLVILRNCGATGFCEEPCPSILYDYWSVHEHASVALHTIPPAGHSA